MLEAVSLTYISKYRAGCQNVLNARDMSSMFLSTFFFCEISGLQPLLGEQHQPIKNLVTRTEYKLLVRYQAV